MGTCHVCPPGSDPVPDTDLLDHLRLLHPQVYGDGPERWPDGRLVIVDTALDPAEFTTDTE